MYLLKLFHQSEPGQPLAAQLAAGGRIRVGRDPGSDWVIPDPDCEVSRTHLELVCADGRLTMTPLGTNGVFDAAGERMPDGEERPLQPGETIGFGKYRIRVETAPAARGGARYLERTLLAAPLGTDMEVPEAWPERTLHPGNGGDMLLDAFCRGADLDISSLSAADAAVVLERAGAIYRQTVLGLADLMRARASIKADHGLERTTIGPAHNNPFKWAPSRRLAADLLLQEAGLMAGPDAIRASIADLKKHMMATLAGFEAAVGAILDATDPATIELRASAQKSLLRGRHAACWDELKTVHDTFANGGQADGGPIARTFAEAYERTLSLLEEAGGDTEIREARKLS